MKKSIAQILFVKGFLMHTRIFPYIGIPGQLLWIARGRARGRLRVES